MGTDENGDDIFYEQPAFNFECAACNKCGSKTWGESFLNEETGEIDYCDNCAVNGVVH